MYQYKKMELDDEAVGNLIYVNSHLIHRTRNEIKDSYVVSTWTLISFPCICSQDRPFTECPFFSQALATVEQSQIRSLLLVYYVRLDSVR